MKPFRIHGKLAALAWLSAIPVTIQAEVTPAGLLFEEKFDAPAAATSFDGDARPIDFGRLESETTGQCAQLDSAKDINGDGQHAGAVKFGVTGLQGSEGKWFRFSFRGLPGKDFQVKDDGDLEMRVRFFSGTKPLDGVVKELYPSIKADRRDIEKNGDLAKYGSSAWTAYAFDFLLPFNDIDNVELSVSFRNGEGKAPYGSFFVDDVKLERIAAQPTAVEAKSASPLPIDKSALLPIGGRWFYLPDRTDATVAVPRHYDSSNLDRLVYQTGEILETPFAVNRGAWLRKGFKDSRGQIVREDEWLNNTLQVDFTQDQMVVHSLDIPNHPTGVFPGYLGNRSYIQEQNVVAYLPLNPRRNPNAKAMTDRDANGALPMGPTGIAVNGVVFYNPFDAQMNEAVNIMDRCCGHPDPANRYHYHKYPVCSRSPFEDKGETHSPLIGWAYDGFPVYGPYEGHGEMAMNSQTNPLNDFNIHYDEARGWHYHVTPGKFPYIIGGYWGEVDRRNTWRPGPPR